MKAARLIVGSPLTWALIALAVFLVGLCPWVYPGDAAALMGEILGVLPGGGTAHPLTRVLFGSLAFGSVTGMNVLSAVLGALGVGLACAVVRTFFDLVEPDLRTEHHLPWAKAMAAAAAGVACLLSPDWVRASTHFQWQTFDLFLALAGTLLAFRTAVNGSCARMAVASLVLGLAAFESVSLTFLVPVLAVVTALGHFFAHERLHPSHYLTYLIVPFAVGALITFGVVAALSPLGVVGAIKIHALGLLAEGTRFFQGPWILMAFFAFLPGVLAPFVVRAIGGNRLTFPILVTCLALAALAVLSFLPLPITPSALATDEKWGETYPLIGAAAIALGFGAAIGSLTLLRNVRVAAEGGEESGLFRFLGRRLGFYGLPLALAAVIGFGLYGLLGALAAERVGDGTPADLTAAYADAVLDGAQVDWLIADRWQAPYLTLRRAERESGPLLIDPADRESVQTALQEAEWFTPERREDLALYLRDGGFLSFLQVWQEYDRADAEDKRGDEAAIHRRLATASLNFLSPFRDPSKAQVAQGIINGLLIPGGPVYRFAKDFESRRDALTLPEDPSVGLACGTDAIAENAFPAVRTFVETLRHRLSASATNAAFTSSVIGKSTDAQKLLEQVHAFDPDNIVALVFLYDMAVRADDEALRRRCDEALSELLTRLRADKRRLSVEEVLIAQGYLPTRPLLDVLLWQYDRGLRMADILAQLKDGAEHYKRELAKLSENPGQLLAASLNAAANDPAGRQNAIATLRGLRQGADEAERTLKEKLAAATDPAERADLEKALVDVRKAKLATLHDLALINLQAGDVNAARDAITEGDALSEPNAFAYEWALLHALTGKTAEASKALDIHLGKNPNDVEAISILANFQIAAGDFKTLREETLVRLKVAIEGKAKEAGRAMPSKSDNYPLTIVNAQLCLAEGNLDEARTHFREALEVRPQIEALRNVILELDLRLSDIAAQMTDADDFLLYDPNIPFANYVKGHLALENGTPQDAVTYLTRSIRAGSRMGYLNAAHNDLAEAYRRQGQWDAAIENAKKAIELSPDLAVAHETLASACLGKGDLAQAEKAIKQAFDISARLAPGQPVDPRFILTRGRLYHLRGQDAEARQEVRDLLNRQSELDRAAREEFNALRQALGL